MFDRPEQLPIGYVAWVYEKAAGLYGVQRPARDQWLRASQTIPLIIAEGNGTPATADRRRYVMAPSKAPGLKAEGLRNRTRDCLNRERAVFQTLPWSVTVLDLRPLRLQPSALTALFKGAVKEDGAVKQKRNRRVEAPGGFRLSMSCSDRFRR